MYAVIEAGGKQYRVELGTTLVVDRMEAEPGTEVTFDRVLLVADEETAVVGRPFVADASVTAEVLRRQRGEKIDVFKYRPKARRRVKKGFRAELTVVRITDLRLDGRSAADEARQAEEAQRTERQRLEEAARRQAEADAALAAQLAERTRRKAEGSDGGSRPPRRSRRPPAPAGGQDRPDSPEPSEGATAARAEAPASPGPSAPSPGAEVAGPQHDAEPDGKTRGRRRRTRNDEG